MSKGSAIPQLPPSKTANKKRYQTQGSEVSLTKDRIFSGDLSGRFARCQKFPSERPLRCRSNIEMKRRLLLSTFALLVVLNLLLGVRFYTAHAAGEEEDSGYVQISVFAKAVQLLRQDYVDGNKTSYRDLIYAAMKGMLASLDPHSQFMEPNDFKDMQDDTRSRFNGLGIEVAVKGGLLTVITPMEDTPAAKAGILSGDQILRINGNSTEKMELQDAVNFLRATSGQKVTLTILRPSTKEIKDFALERTEIKVQSVKGGKLLDAELGGTFKIGYVRIIQF